MNPNGYMSDVFIFSSRNQWFTLDEKVHIWGDRHELEVHMNMRNY
jgi:hypothetical protein